MNAKRCKRIRRALSGLPIAEFKMEYESRYIKRKTVSSNLHKKTEDDFIAALFPLTFKYPENSYQRFYRDVKRVS